MCGIVGLVSKHPVATELYDSLIHLQHRGQDAAGVLSCDQAFHGKRGLGLVREVFEPADMAALPGNMGLAHVRYPTAGGRSLADVQPFVIDSPQPMALAHNGNLLNYDQLKQWLSAQGTTLASSSDSEVMLHLLARRLDAQADGLASPDFFAALEVAVGDVFDQVQGAYSVVATVLGHGLFAFRDPHGIRPLVLGERVDEQGQKDYIVASEPTMFYALDFKLVGSVAPGELIYIDAQRRLHRKQLVQKSLAPCIFEYVYFARPDAVLDEVSVYRSRLRMGQNLAKQWQQQYPALKPDIVIPVPFTANTAALSFAHELGVRYSEGLYKNPFIGRTFIMPSHQARKKSVRYKLTPQETEIRGKKVMMVDDSVVRGTTSREIVRMVREHGASEIYFASSAPPIKHPCFYGIDIPSRKDLIAAQMSVDEIKAHIGVDALLYQRDVDLVEAVMRRGEHSMDNPCRACMNGCYVTGGLDQKAQQRLEQLREAGA
jgi:amidophosphoribosyltransferase